MEKKSAVKSSLWAIATIAVCIVIVIILKQCRGSDAPGTGKAVDSLYYKHITDSTKAAVLFGAKEDFSIIENSYKDSIARLLKIKPKTIKEIATITQESSSNLHPIGETVIQYDTINGNCPLQVESMSGEFANNYYTAQVGLGKDTYMFLQGVDTITGVWSEVTIKRKKYYEFSVMNSNPDVKINSVKAFRSPEVDGQKDWSISIQAGWGAIYHQKQFFTGPYLGLGISRNIFSFNLKKKNK